MRMRIKPLGILVVAIAEAVSGEQVEARRGIWVPAH
jgi:hypothetical protein